MHSSGKKTPPKSHNSSPGHNESERRPFLLDSSEDDIDVTMHKVKDDDDLSGDRQVQTPGSKSRKSKSTDKYKSTVSTPVFATLLIAICLQNSAYSLLRRFAVRMNASAAKPSDSSILIGGECIKLVVSLLMVVVPTKLATATSTDLMTTASGQTRRGGSTMQHLKWVMSLSPKMMIPAVVYYAMNRLSFVALRRIDAGTFTVCAQLKTATTAIFSFLILGRRFSGPQIRALVHMICSVIVISEFAARHSTSGGGKDADDATADEQSLAVFTFGLAAVITEVTLSGAISVYYEKVLKDDITKSGISVWDRNIQLAIFSIVLYFPTFVTDGLFQNWTPLTVVISILGASGGLMVAFSIKYTNAILKALATSAAIVITAFAGALWLDAPFGVPIVASSVSVVIAILTYVTNGDLFSSLCSESK